MAAPGRDEVETQNFPLALLQERVYLPVEA